MVKISQVLLRNDLFARSFKISINPFPPPVIIFTIILSFTVDQVVMEFPLVMRPIPILLQALPIFLPIDKVSFVNIVPNNFLALAMR